MLSADTTTQRADQIFRSGPETLVSASSSIVAGPLSHYSKEILQTADAGTDHLPVEWKVTAEIATPVTLKGTPRSGPITFSRIERSFLSSTRSPSPYWVREYGDLSASGAVVLFYSSDNANPQVVPSGAGDLDLAALVKDIVSIQNIAAPAAQIDRWLAYLNSGPGEEPTRTALRSLAQLKVDWRRLEPSLKKLLSAQNQSQDLRDYAFGFITFQLAHDAWLKDSSEALALLCDSFQHQNNPKSQLRYLDGFSLLLDYASRQPAQPSQRPTRRSIEDCLKLWAGSAIADAQALEEYKRLRQQYKLP